MFQGVLYESAMMLDPKTYWESIFKTIIPYNIYAKRCMKIPNIQDEKHIRISTNELDRRFRLKFKIQLFLFDEKQI